MSTSRPTYPFISEEFQRFDIADHALLTKAQLDAAN